MRVLPTPDTIIGSGAIRQIPDALKGLGARTVMVVTDPGLVTAGGCVKKPPPPGGREDPPVRAVGVIRRRTIRIPLKNAS